MVKLIIQSVYKTNQTFFYNFFLDIKLSTGYYKKNKERLRKNAPEKYQHSSQEEKTKSKRMVVGNVEISQKMKNKG